MPQVRPRAWWSSGWAISSFPMPRARRTGRRIQIIKFDWKLNGRTVPADRIGEAFAKAANAEIDARVKDAIAQVKCRVHGTSPRNIKAGRA